MGAFGGCFGGCLGVFGSIFGAVFGGVWEAFSKYFWRFFWGKNRKNNVLIILSNVLMLLMFLISLCGYSLYIPLEGPY